MLINRQKERKRKNNTMKHRLRLTLLTASLLLAVLLALTGQVGQTEARALKIQGTWKLTGSTNEPRNSTSAEALLPNGKVLVAGAGGSRLSSAELYDPTTGTWSLTGSMHVGRWDLVATLLPNDKVLVA